MLIHCQNLSLGYGRKILFRDLSFELGEGQYLCIVGANGAGKSTLLRALLGLHRPFAGQILIDRNLGRHPFAYVAQDDATQRGFPATVAEIVASGAIQDNRFPAFFDKTLQRAAHDMLERLGLEQLAPCAYARLSGGQRQRVRIARALMAGKAVLILDEPEAGLDPPSVSELLTLLAQIRDQGRSILHVTHQIDNALAAADSLLHLDPEGSRDGAARALYYPDIHMFLDSPWGRLYASQNHAEEPRHA